MLKTIATSGFLTAL